MDNEATKKQRRFMVEWSILNLLGWIIGLVLVLLIAYNLETIKHFVWVRGWATDFRKEWTGEAALIWFPFGLSLGIFQWLKLRRIGINLFMWTFASLIGFTAFISLFSWVEKFGSFDYQMKYGIPYWIVTLGLALSLPIGGFMFGGLQLLVLRNRVARSTQWIRAYVFGSLLPPVIIPLGFLVKSFFLRIFYSLRLWTLVDLRWDLFFGFLFILMALCISVLTGRILLNQTNIGSATPKTG
jgi:hypothetical protein